MKLAVIRPARLTDLPSLLSFALSAGYGITSLPNNPRVLKKKLEHSLHAFKTELLNPSHETYLFCLEQNEEVIGTSGIVSRIGMDEPFFAYHLRYEHTHCPHLGIERQIPLLHFTEARKKPTEIGTLFLAEKFRNKVLGRLLSLSRFLFIATFKDRFASTVIAELRGINREGYSPFWEAVGRFFFQMDFPKADFLRTEHPAFIEELAPKHPIYVELLPQEAQNAIGNTHADTAAAKRLLEKQGFKVSHYIDLFDAGPHLYAHTDEIDVIRSSHKGILANLRSEITNAPLALIANNRLDFRATCAPIRVENQQISLHPDAAAVLEIKIDDPIRYYFI